MKSSAEANGVDLVIERVESAPPELGKLQPELNYRQSQQFIRSGGKRAALICSSCNNAKAYTEMWQPADKSNVSLIDFAPPLIMPGVWRNWNSTRFKSSKKSESDNGRRFL